ncbi:MAG: LysM peptidoglycan-binding domain-containing protein [Roseburia sp.]|nr:LysM peptidoglycan-binding domain-containing protein [Roseburia sp.]
MKRKILSVICLLFIMTILGTTIFIAREKDSDTIVWDDTIRGLFFSDDKLSDRECFSHYLMEKAESYDYIMAEILAGKESGEFKWTYGTDRDSVAESYKLQKTAPSIQNKDSPADHWFFLKLKVDDVPISDIWNEVQKHWGTSLKDGHRLDASVNEAGTVYKMCEYEGSYPVNTWSAFINGDYFYAIECVEYLLSTYEELREPMLFFYTENMLPQPMDYCGHNVDEELLYWHDHDSRDIPLEDPHRIFHQVSGIDSGCYDQPFGVTESAEYTIQLSEDLPEVKISFTLEEDIQDLFIFRSHATMCPYTMKTTDVKTDKLISETSITMSVDTIDTIRFADLNNDGYLDMSVVCPEHYMIDEYEIYTNSSVLADAYNNNLTDTWFSFYIDDEYYDDSSFGNYYYNPITRYIWNPEDMYFEEKTLKEIYCCSQENDTAYVTVQPGDTLWDIAKLHLGNEEDYMSLYEMNREVVGDDPDRILPGMEIKVK